MIKRTLSTTSSTFHRFPAPQSVVQRYLLQMRRASVYTVDVTVDSCHGNGQAIFRTRVHWIMPSSVEQTARRIGRWRWPNRSHAVYLPLEPILTTFGHRRVNAFLKTQKQKRSPKLMSRSGTSDTSNLYVWNK